MDVLPRLGQLRVRRGLGLRGLLAGRTQLLGRQLRELRGVALVEAGRGRGHGLDRGLGLDDVSLRLPEKSLFLSGAGVRLDVGEALRVCLELLLVLLQPPDGLLRSRRREALRLHQLRRDKHPGDGDRGVRRGRRRLAGLDGHQRLLDGQLLDAHQEGALGVRDLRDRILHDLKLVTGLLDQGLAAHLFHRLLLRVLELLQALLRGPRALLELLHLGKHKAGRDGLPSQDQLKHGLHQAHGLGHRHVSLHHHVLRGASLRQQQRGLFGLVALDLCRRQLLHDLSNAPLRRLSLHEVLLHCLQRIQLVLRLQELRVELVDLRDGGVSGGRGLELPHRNVLLVQEDASGADRILRHLHGRLRLVDRPLRLGQVFTSSLDHL
mmetsp:Transcript_410/g.1822  ORF Transcript_410/g.1822 Transcript_410/m.1822 type:complete len:379 (+) Transcript_410:3951-5087(+)